MNKFYLLLAIALPLVFISCGDDKDEPVTPDTHCPAARCGRRVTSVPTALRNMATTSPGARPLPRIPMNGATTSGRIGNMIPSVIIIIAFWKRRGISTIT